ncbi:Transcription factor [Pleurostoma richardsiae]|uniref:Transcription factor n=1 Tax=Pleurostoma richardsiae TaxID=41990 RepID=A0AA38VKK6_9PEZI|nr:Transcription factor [Pleurostoma richardsiae]
MLPGKRSWDDANPHPEADAVWARSSLSGARRHGHPTQLHPHNKPAPMTTGDEGHSGRADQLAQSIPMISRKVKACAACRKHKIKCIMEESGPPCRRCVEKNLGCTLNKSLQTLISERTELSEAMIQDMEMMHTNLQKVMKALNLPPPARLQCSRPGLRTPASEEPGDARPFDEAGPSCDNSPKISPEDDNSLTQVPIQSVYRLTKLRALRSPDAGESENGPRQPDNAIDDFITRGLLAYDDAERLFRLYMDHLDHFMYGIGGRHKTLDALRRSSRILTACIFTVAALHDAHGSGSLYGTCMREFRRLMAASIFSRRIDRDYLRAMCIASYWLSEISWMLSGYAIRRAAELNLSSHHRRAITEGSEDAVDYVRLWYVLYICDQHLSTLYGRQPIIRDDPALRGWEAFIDSPATIDEDKRLASQVALLNIIHNIRELFGPDAGEPVPQVYVMQIASFARQLDRWLAQWSSTLPEHHERIGGFPRKGVLLHYHFATLHLHSQVFRGLLDRSIPAHFLDSAASAVSAATAIVNLLITDPEMQPALIGMPSYMHSMTAFACMFLAKLAMMPNDELVERAVVIGLTSRLIELYRSTSVGRWHLVNLMADGLEKMVETLRQPDLASVTQAGETAAPFGTQTQNVAGFGDPGFSGDSSFNFHANFLMDNNISLGASPLMYLSHGPAVFDTTDLSPTSFLQ